VDAQLADAEGAAAMAQRQLGVLLGSEGGELPVGVEAPARLPSSDRVRAVVAADTADAIPGPRADLRAASEGLAAARADALRARSAYLPRLNSFARYDWNSADRLYGGDRNWTIGVMASWSPFTGASELAEVQATAGRVQTTEAQAEAARANARLEAEQTRTALVVALTRLEIAERAVTQSAEAHRIVGRKYEGGLATVTELLDAQAAETQSALSLSQARWSAIVADAERLRALGRDPGVLQSLDDSAVAAQDAVTRR
jgi:outer membrane protein TolC